MTTTNTDIDTGKAFLHGILLAVVIFASCSICDRAIDRRNEALREEGRIEALREVSRS